MPEELRDPHEIARSISNKIDGLQTDIEDALWYTLAGESSEYRRAVRHNATESLRNIYLRLIDKIVQGTYEPVNPFADEES